MIEVSARAASSAATTVATAAAARGISGGVLSGGSLRLSGGELLGQLGVLKLGGFDSGQLAATASWNA